jgi:hypothetical protein
MTHAQVAKRVRLEKEKHPEKFCLVEGCLYRIEGYCPKHITKAYAPFGVNINRQIK